ncbi:MAG: DNA polymerase IV [Prevotella sp.]|nr:DNA polymerase IV [Prevotella sp.]
MRKIIHIDMDAFFASVEQRDNPGLRGKPIAVGYDGERGVVSTASYEARRYGVHSAQSMVVAKRRCPDLVVVPARFHIYKEVSAQVHEIFHEYTDLVEPLSIDEAFLDVTDNKKGIGLAQDIALEIKSKIRQRTQLTASAGVSYNKFLAKIASDYRKPDGLFVIHPDRALDFIAHLPIERFWGVGPKTAERLHRMGVFTGAQLREVSMQHLEDVFGKAGPMYYRFARGIDNRAVIVERERKSVGCEHTFLQDISTHSAVVIELYHTVMELLDRIGRSGFDGRTLTLKVKFSNFIQVTRSTTSAQVLKTKEQILPLAKQLLKQVSYSAEHPIRLLGLSVSRSLSASEPTEDSSWEEGWLDFIDP